MKNVTTNTQTFCTKLSMKKDGSSNGVNGCAASFGLPALSMLNSQRWKKQLSLPTSCFKTTSNGGGFFATHGGRNSNVTGGDGGGYSLDSLTDVLTAAEHELSSSSLFQHHINQEQYDPLPFDASNIDAFMKGEEDDGHQDQHDETAFDLLMMEPTPITPSMERVNVVDKVLVADMYAHWNPDSTSIMLLQQLLNQQDNGEQEDNDHHLPIAVVSPSVSRSSSDHDATSSLEEQEDDMSTTTTKASKHAVFYKTEQWNDRYHELVKFVEDFGHCLVPHNWDQNRTLAQWVKRQRYQYKLKCEGKHTTLTDDRLDMLQKLGFVWSSHNVNWEEKYLQLEDFRYKHGHCNVPSVYPENRQLAIWVRCQRRQYKLFTLQRADQPSSMTTERIEKLRSIGFMFDPRKEKSTNHAGKRSTATSSRR